VHRALGLLLCAAVLGQGKSWSGKYESDNLWGHKAGVKALKLLPSHGVLLTGATCCAVRP
jgi:hypothetical protein